MTLTQLNLLSKLLNLTASSNDAEALAAARKANQLLRDARVTWDQILRKQVAVSRPHDEGPEVSDDEDGTREHVQRCLDTLRGMDLGDFSRFVASLDKQWATRGYLSPDQRRPLFAAYERHVRK